ncbi:transcriptional regulator, TetR family [Singulisphaera sp. GP187]|uniref:CerR family C-terminal domain-containing protein n=1 Tax=Singulisphaera sp. GP187 TaxID=1882752 RepID=UPI00092954EC|nr:CerR family C-terminal domain-containing protein [Singulisphaera sp. GP187]SIO59571.1 transcriptional regulator, TetR family [Singulisphaera sp. GP187]
MAIPDQTKTRLLEAAGEEFAEKGFDAARVRAICRRAEVNLAAINYHFGDKERLYTEAVLEAHRCGSEVLPDSVFQEAEPADQLRRYIHHFLSHVVSLRGQPKWHHTLILREMLQPTSASEVLVREAIRPRFERLLGILRKVCGDADERRLHALAFSVIGQCLHYKMARPVSERLIGTDAFEALDLDFLTEHIATFCLAALGLVPPLNAAGESSGGGVGLGARTVLPRGNEEENGDVLDRVEDVDG